MIQEKDDNTTPWSTLHGESVRVFPANGPLSADLTLPGSKSLTNRALILAAMSTGASQLSGLLKSDDTYWCVDALTRLGAMIDFDGSSAVVHGIGRTRPKQGEIHVGSAGTVARFLPPLLAAGDKGSWRITASKQMTERPIQPLFQALIEGGAIVTFDGRPGCFPVTIEGGSFSGGRIRMSGAVSSQFISGILMSGPQTRDGLILDIDGGIVQSEYVRITLDVMRRFGVTAESNAGFDHFQVSPGEYRPCSLEIEADASTATYFGALAAVTAGRIRLTNLSETTRQPDYGFLGILERLGCRVDRTSRDTTIYGVKPLRGGFSVDMRPLSDSALTLAAIAPFADAPVTITGVEHIRHHESDRIQAICRSLAAVGVSVEEHADGLTIHPGAPNFARLDTFDDHRVAMALTVLGAAGKGVELLNPACVSKTCPTFFELVDSIGIRTEFT